MDENMLIILSKCPKCIDIYLKIHEDYSFLFEELGGSVEKCSGNHYGCDIWVQVKGIMIWFETAYKDGIELGYGVSLPVSDPDNKLNKPHSIGTILDFIDDKGPPEYKGPGWVDNRASTPDQLRNAIIKIIEFYNSHQFANRARDFNEWHEKYEHTFRNSINKYYKTRHSSLQD